MVEKTGLGIGHRKGRPQSKHQIKTYTINYNKGRVVWGENLVERFREESKVLENQGHISTGHCPNSGV